MFTNLELDLNEIREGVLELRGSVTKQTAAQDDAEADTSALLSYHRLLQPVESRRVISPPKLAHREITCDFRLQFRILLGHLRAVSARA